MADGIVAEVEYRELPQFPGYRFGNDGSVWSRWTAGRSAHIGDEWNLRMPAVHPDYGYYSVTLYDARFQKHKTFRLHRVILEAFVGPAPECMEGCHDDRDKSNNALSNLRWDTPKNNTHDKFRHGTMLMGEAHANATITADDVREIRRLHAAGWGGYRRIGVRFGLCPGHVRDIIKRKIWSHVAVK